MSARLLRILIIPIGLAPLLVPGTATPENAKHGNLTRISNTSPFAEDPGRDCHELGAEGEDDAEAEVIIAVNPSDPEHVVVAWMQDMYDGIVTTTSEDAGETWSEFGVPPGLNGCSGDDEANPVLAAVADPALSIGPGGIRPDGTLDRDGQTVYLASFTVQGHGGGRLQVSRSFDGGYTWEERVVIQDAPPHHDRPTVAADPDNPCHAYLAWDHSPLGDPGVWFSETNDCGESWSIPSHAFGGEEGAVQSQIRVLPGGDLLATAVLRGEKATVIASRFTESGSENLGRQWSEPVEVASFTTASSTIEDPDPDPGESTHTVYTEPSWAFLDVAPDGEAYVAFPNRLEDEEGNEIGREIRVARSRDGGKTWEKETTIASPEEAVQPFIPTIAVAGDGTVGLTYYDTRNDGPDDEPLVENGGEPWIVDLFFAYSVDGGLTWKEQHLAGPVDLRPSFTRTLPDVPGYGWIGDYNGMVGLPHGFAAAFALSPPIAEFGASDIFFTNICFRGGKACFKDRKTGEPTRQNMDATNDSAGHALLRRAVLAR